MLVARGIRVRSNAGLIWQFCHSGFLENALMTFPLSPDCMSLHLVQVCRSILITGLCLSALTAFGASAGQTSLEAKPPVSEPAGEIPAGEEEVQKQAEQADPPVMLSDEEVQKLLSELTSTDFSKRQQAVVSLRTVSAEQIRLLLNAVAEQSAPEATRQVFELLEGFYSGDDPQKVLVASEIIENCTTSDRWMTAEAAGEILNRQWRRRSKLAIEHLQTLGARINSDNLESFAQGFAGRNRFMFQAGEQPQLQINMVKSWKGGERGLQELERLAAVIRGENSVGEMRAAVYLIDEHPLSESEVARLKAAFGDTRVVSRGRVCLGITNNIFFGDERGCRVGDVKENTSAFDAGILADDVILSVDDIEIRDFDHLVQMLRKYDVGDKVKMRIIRDSAGFPDAPPGIRAAPPVPPEPEKIEAKKPPGFDNRAPRRNELTIVVELKSW